VETVFVTQVSTTGQRAGARLLIDSVRAFGGSLRHCPIWLFEADPQEVPCRDLESADVRVLPLAVPDTVLHYWYAAKVYACARAEEMAGRSVRSLIWLSPNCFVVNPPLLFDLAPSFDAAVRPVHVTNVGLVASEPVDGFWQRIFEAVGVQDIETTVESFVETQRIRAYFNSHALAVNPSKGVFRRWFELFESLVRDQAFQLDSCQDVRHQVFLHSAILSALLVTSLDSERIRILPPDYGYPYNLHQRVPSDRRAVALNDLVCVAYDERSLDPGLMDDIQVHEPLHSWLSAHFR
jgi:hypothetical protein